MLCIIKLLYTKTREVEELALLKNPNMHEYKRENPVESK